MSIEHSGFAKDDVGFATVVGLGGILDALKPHKVDAACAIGEMGNEAFVAPLSHRVERENLSAELDVGHRSVNVANLVDATAVNIFIGVICQEVAHGLDAEFVGKQQSTLWSHSLQVLDVLAQDIHIIILPQPDRPTTWRADAGFLRVP